MNEKLVARIKREFTFRHSLEPKIGVFAPGRINLIGEHTDYNDGYVFPAAIDKGMVAMLSKSQNTECEVLACDLDESFDFNIENLEPIINGSWRNYILGIVKELTKVGCKVNGFKLVFGGDIPPGTGMSSSAALENSVAFGLNELFGLGLSRLQLIHVSQKAEHNHVGVNCGIMDQYASMLGQQGHAMLLDCRTLKSKLYKIEMDGYSIVLINSNVRHDLAEDAYNDRRISCERVAAKLNVKALRDATLLDLNLKRDKIAPSDYAMAKYVIKENDRVLAAADFLDKGEIVKFGNLLYKAHEDMKDNFKISCDELDFLVEEARLSKTVAGARLMGGGFGGCTINIVKDEGIEAFIDNTRKKYKEKFNMECTPIAISLENGVRPIQL